MYTSIHWPGLLPFVSQGWVRYIHVQCVCFPHATKQNATILTISLVFVNIYFLFLMVKITSLKPSPFFPLEFVVCSVVGHEEKRAMLCVDTVFLWGKQNFHGCSWILTNQNVWVFKKEKVIIKWHYMWSKPVWKMGERSPMPTWDFERLLFLLQNNFNCTEDCQHG